MTKPTMQPPFSSMNNYLNQPVPTDPWATTSAGPEHQTKRWALCNSTVRHCVPIIGQDETTQSYDVDTTDTVDTDYTDSPSTEVFCSVRRTLPGSTSKDHHHQTPMLLNLVTPLMKCIALHPERTRGTTDASTSRMTATTQGNTSDHQSTASTNAKKSLPTDQAHEQSKPKVQRGKNQNAKLGITTTEWRCLHEAGLGNESCHRYSCTQFSSLVRNIRDVHAQELYDGKTFIQIYKALLPGHNLRYEEDCEKLWLSVFRQMHPGKNPVYLRFERLPSGRRQPLSIRYRPDPPQEPMLANGAQDADSPDVRAPRGSQLLPRATSSGDRHTTSLPVSASLASPMPEETVASASNSSRLGTTTDMAASSASTSRFSLALENAEAHIQAHPNLKPIYVDIWKQFKADSQKVNQQRINLKRKYEAEDNGLKQQLQQVTNLAQSKLEDTSRRFFHSVQPDPIFEHGSGSRSDNVGESTIGTGTYFQNDPLSAPDEHSNDNDINLSSQVPLAGTVNQTSFSHPSNHPITTRAIDSRSLRPSHHTQPSDNSSGTLQTFTSSTLDVTEQIHSSPEGKGKQRADDFRSPTMGRLDDDNDDDEQEHESQAD